MEIPYIDYVQLGEALSGMGIPKGNIYGNWSKDDADNLQDKFNFYQGYLQTGRKFSKENSYFYFSEDYRLGGGAIKIDQNYFAKIYIGTFNRLHNLFTTNETLFDTQGLKAVKEANAHTDFPINELMCQICLHFTYYHEVAHLHQDSKFLIHEQTEDHSNAKYDFERHFLEYDADIFAALSVCTHIFQYFDKYHYRKTIEDLEEITAILLAAILIRILLSPGIKVDFYTKETTHPHWIIRMMKIIEVIPTQLDTLVSTKYTINSLSKVELIRKSLIYARILNNELSLDIDFSNVQNMIKDNIADIKSYSEELMEGVSGYEKSAFNKWNEFSNNK